MAKDTKDKRRTYGTGGIEWLDDNRIRLTVSLGTDATGKRIKKTKVVKDITKQSDAQKAFDEFKKELENKSYDNPEKLSVSAYLKNWLNDYASVNVEKTTYQRYVELIENYATPNIGRYELRQIKPTHFVQLYNILLKGGRKDKKPGGLSGSTVLQLHRILAKAFKTACEWQLLTKTPLEYVKPPKKDTPEMQALDEEQATEMLEKAMEEGPLWFYTLISLALVGGFRRGELLGMRWADINFEKNLLSVNHSLQYVKNEGKSLKAPKTKKSNRVVPMPDDAMILLKYLKEEQLFRRKRLGNKWQDLDLVFTGWDGRMMCPDNVSHKFTDFMSKTNLPKIRFHDLRHSAASIMIAKNIHSKIVSSRLGHSNISTTMDIYGKVFDSVNREAADKMSGIIPQREQPKKALAGVK